MTTAAIGPTFRDPSGSLRFEGDWAIRHIHPDARRPVLDFVTSSFYQRLQERGDIVATTIDDASGGLRLLHPRIPVPAYPWEWTPSQWQAAGDLTLSLCEEALREGWILKDATPLNVLFVGPRPVFVDVLSFERRDPASPVWLAYGQYIRTFLLPLLMNQLLNWPLELSMFRRDGYEPSELYSVLGWRQRLSRTALWPITLPAWLEARKSTGAKAQSSLPAFTGDTQLAATLVQRKLDDLRRRTRRALAKDYASEWKEYTQTQAHYTAEQSARKHAWVKDVLEELHPKHVLDVGANTGEFSALAGAMGAQVVALERDQASAEQIFRMSRSRNLSIQTIHADLGRPTPPVGWENRESSGLLSRLELQFELILMLAVLHHLLLIEQIPLPAIVTLCHRLTRQHLVMEWVPVEDPMYQSLMRGRDNLYGSLTEADLLSACSGHFRVVRQLTLENGRILFLFEKE